MAPRPSFSADDGEVWENQRWGVDPRTGVSGFDHRHLFSTERARFSSNRKALADAFEKCEQAEEKWHVDNDQTRDGASAEKSADWLYGVNFTSRPGELSRTQLPHHFVRTRRWIRRGAPGPVTSAETAREQSPIADASASPARGVAELGEDGTRCDGELTEARYKDSACKSVTDDVGRPSAVRPSPLDDEVLWDEVLLDEACVWVRCERLRRSLHLCGCAALVAVPLLLALGSGLVTLATRKLAAPLGLLKAPLTASSAVLLALLAPALLASLLMVPIKGTSECAATAALRVALAYRLSYLLGTRVEMLQLQVKFSPSCERLFALELVLRGLTVVDPTFSDDRAMLRVGSVSATLALRDMLRALLGKSGTLYRFETLEMQDCDLFFEQFGNTSHLNCDFVARWTSPEAVGVAQVQGKTSKREGMERVFGALGGDVVHSALLGFEQCERFTKRVGQLTLRPAWFDYAGRVEAFVAVKRASVRGFRARVGASVYTALKSVVEVAPSGFVLELPYVAVSSRDALAHLRRPLKCEEALLFLKTTPLKKKKPGALEEDASPRVAARGALDDARSTDCDDACSVETLGTLLGVKLRESAQQEVRKKLLGSSEKELVATIGTTIAQLRNKTPQELVKIARDLASCASARPRLGATTGRSLADELDVASLVDAVFDDHDAEATATPRALLQRLRAVIEHSQPRDASRDESRLRTAQALASSASSTLQPIVGVARDVATREKGPSIGATPPPPPPPPPPEGTVTILDEIEGVLLDKRLPTKELVRRLVKETVVGAALESVGVDTDALVGASGETSLDRVLQFALDTLEDREDDQRHSKPASTRPHSPFNSLAISAPIAQTTIDALVPLLRACRRTLEEEWAVDSEASSALEKLDGVLLSLDALRVETMRELRLERHAAAAPAEAQTRACEEEGSLGDRLLAACATVASVSKRLERFVTPHAIEALALTLATHADSHVIAALTERALEVFLDLFSTLPVGAFQGELKAPSWLGGGFDYALRNIDLSKVELRREQLELRLLGATVDELYAAPGARRETPYGLATVKRYDAAAQMYEVRLDWGAAATLRPECVRSLHEEASSPHAQVPHSAAAPVVVKQSALASAHCDEPTRHRSRSCWITEGCLLCARQDANLLSIAMRELRAPLTDVRWSFTQRQWPYAADAGSADAALDGLSLVLTFAARRDARPPHATFLTVSEVEVELEAVALTVSETRAAGIYNTAASALAVPLRDYVAASIESQLRSEAGARVDALNAYLDDNSLWPLLLALSHLCETDIPIAAREIDPQIKSSIDTDNTPKLLPGARPRARPPIMANTKSFNSQKSHSEPHLTRPHAQFQ